MLSAVAVVTISLCAAALAQGIGLPGQSRNTPLEINADQGIEWQQKTKAYIARGNARAAQGDVAVHADTLTAYYREKDGGGTSIWRIDAENNVRIVTPTQRAFGNKGVYDVDNGILVLTGNVRMETETDRITAQDSLEYWEKRNLAVARGNAIAERGDNKLRADVLTAHFFKDAKGKSRVRKIDAFDNIVITTPDEIVRSNRGVYDVETGIAKLTGSVKITRGTNQLNGEYAEVNLNTGVSRLFGRGGSVRGIFTPEAVEKPKSTDRKTIAGGAVTDSDITGRDGFGNTPVSVLGDRIDGDAPRLVAENTGLQINKIGKRFKKRPVLREVSMNLNRGEVVGLLGPNGAGKTTCFYIVTGLIAPDYGSIALDGHDVTGLPMYRRARLGVGYLPQEASIFRGMTVENNIRAVLEVTDDNPARREARLEELLAEFSVSHLRRTPSLALSGGERRRVEIARALASDPSFMLLDEPFAGIDPIAVDDIRNLVAHLKDRGIGVLITDHNVRETLDIVDRAYILHDGAVLMEGAPSEIVAHKDVRRVYLGERFSL